jgi:hypothetical protein
MGTPVIADVASLQEWRRQVRSLKATRDLPKVVFQLPELSAERNRSLSAMADAYRTACGCSVGRFVMSAAFVGSMLSYFLGGGTLERPSLQQFVALFGITFVAALAGKLIGQLWARWRLIRLAACASEVRDLSWRAAPMKR